MMDLRRLARQLAVKNCLSHRFLSEVAGRAWVNLFLLRHKAVLSISKPTETSYARALGFNKENVRNFFHILEEAYTEHQYSADRVYNVDETGLSVVQSKIPKIIGRKVKIQIGDLTLAERGSTVTVIAFMNVKGDFIPPMFIFPRKNMSELLMKCKPIGSFGRAHPSGWVQSNLFVEWLQHFVEKAHLTAESQVLLILDDHYSHVRSLDIIEIARENHNKIISAPPHCTHKLQPLDRTFMNPLKLYYSNEIRSVLLHSNVPLSQYDIMEPFGNAYLKIQRADITVQGFRVTGIIPFDRNIFTYDKFIAAETEAMETGSLPVTCVKVQNSSPSVKIMFQPLAGPSGLLSQSVRSEYVSPFYIAPPSTIKKKNSSRGRKCGGDCLIPGSPYKMSLNESLEKSNVSKSKNTLDFEGEKNQSKRKVTAKNKTNPVKEQI